MGIYQIHICKYLVSLWSLKLYNISSVFMPWTYVESVTWVNANVDLGATGGVS